MLVIQVCHDRGFSKVKFLEIIFLETFAQHSTKFPKADQPLSVVTNL